MGHGGVIFLFFKQESFHFTLFEGFVLAQHSHSFPPISFLFFRFIFLLHFKNIFIVFFKLIFFDIFILF